jgi:hypothetical protein
MSEDTLFCTTCEEFVDTSRMAMIADWSGGRGKRNVAIFQDSQGLAHTVLTSTASVKYRQPEKPEPAAIIIHKPEPTLTKQEAPSKVEQPPRVAAPDASFQKEPTLPDTEATPDESWEPHPNDWYTAVVARVFRGYSFAALSNGDGVFISRDVVAISEGKHICLQTGDDIAVRIRRSNNVGSPWDCLECVVQTPRAFPEKQRGVVTKWSEKGTLGFVERSCGCPILVAVLVPEFLDLGDCVEVSQIVSNERGYIARQIERVLEEENQEEEG